jgi:serine/threonine protein kinase
MTTADIETNSIDSYILAYKNLWLNELKSQGSYQALKITKKVSGLAYGIVVALDPSKCKLAIYVKYTQDKARGSSKKVTFISNSIETLAFSELHRDLRRDAIAIASFKLEGAAYKFFRKCTYVMKGTLIHYRRWSPQKAASSDEIRSVLISENMNFGSLDNMIGNDIFSEKVTKKITLGIALGVSELHTKGISHNDLKPENMLLHQNIGQTPIVKLADLQFLSDQKQGHTINGSPTYTSPEKLLSLPLGTPLQDDIWSLGICFSELMRGRPPYAIAEVTTYDKLLRVMRCPQKIRKVEPKNDTFAHLIWTMLDPKPKLRPTIFKVIEVLQALPESQFIFRGERQPVVDYRLTKSYPPHVRLKARDKVVAKD